MRRTFHQRIYWLASIAMMVIGGAVGVFALSGNVPSSLTRAFEFPVSLGDAVTGNLIPPIGTVPSLTFDHGTVAVGVLPVPLPQSLARLRQRRNQPTFFLPATNDTPRVRLLLSGVVDATGALVNNTGNQLVIDAGVSPVNAATTTPPFVVPFDITNGMAYVDAALPIQTQSDATVDVQVDAITVSDPHGQLFGVLGFHLAARVATPTPLMTSPPGSTPSPQAGQCFVGPDCMGPSFRAPQNLCCHFTRPGAAGALATSWCPAEQFDPLTGQCSGDACVACGTQWPTPTPGPNVCGDGNACGGSCTGACPDGSVAEGKCQAAIFNGPMIVPGSSPIPPGGLCQCVPNCPQWPTPTPGPCSSIAQCDGNCPVTCSDGTTSTGRCMILVVDPPGKAGQPLGATCECIGDCPPPPSPTPGMCGAGNACQGTCIATCANGTTESGKCVGAPPFSPLGTATCNCIAPCNQPTPPPTSTPGPCESSGSCSGPCPVTCSDGTTVMGQCATLLTPGDVGKPRGPICACQGDCPQPPTPTPGQCGTSAHCTGTCPFICPDGTAVTGQCVVLPGGMDAPGPGICGCVANCGAPPPTFPPLPRGTICCQCGAPARKCVDVHWVEVTPACPDGCTAVANGTCDERTNTCAPPTPCSSDRDCDDSNACTVDRCNGGACEHDCVCVTPGACLPGPAMGNPKP